MSSSATPENSGTITEIAVRAGDQLITFSNPHKPKAMTFLLTQESAEGFTAKVGDSIVLDGFPGNVQTICIADRIMHNQTSVPLTARE